MIETLTISISLFFRKKKRVTVQTTMRVKYVWGLIEAK